MSDAIFAIDRDIQFLDRGERGQSSLGNPKSRTAENSIANVQTAARALNIDLQVHKAGILRAALIAHAAKHPVTKNVEPQADAA